MIARWSICPQARFDSGGHIGSVTSGSDLRKTVSVWPDMPAVSQRAKGWQSLRAPQRGVAEPEPVMLARHPDIAIKNRAVTRERGCASCERAGPWSVRVRWGRGCTECSAGVLRVGLWMSVDFFGRTCCRGPKIRLQLRSSLATSAKKVFGKQRLTSLVNVSFPAPYSLRESRSRPSQLSLFV